MAYRQRHRGTTTQRGYGQAHRKLRAQWKPIVDGGHAYCHAARCLMATRWIEPGSSWHLGHTPDRTAWTGPEHERCNESEAATRRNRLHGLRRAWQTSRAW